MFTGIIQSKGEIKKIENRSQDKRFTFGTRDLDLSDIDAGASIAVNGVCLSVVEFSDNGFMADLSTETLSCTTFGYLDVGSEVNLEKSLKLDSRLNGHLVNGHIDGVGKVQKRTSDGRSEQFTIGIPSGLSKFICKKGSVCVDGVSLTVNESNDKFFKVNIIPLTLDETTFGKLTEGDHVNIEVDIIARYINSLVSSGK
jgi:riboflavin synthase